MAVEKEKKGSVEAQTKITVSTKEFSSATFDIGAESIDVLYFVYTGTADADATLPPITQTGRQIWIKNASAYNLTLHSSDGTSVLYLGGVLGATYVLTPGSAVNTYIDGTYVNDSGGIAF